MEGLPQAIDTQESPQEPAAEGSQETSAISPPRDGGYQPYVDLSTLPEDIRGPLEARFSHISKTMKKSEKRYEAKLNDWRSLAQEQAAKIEELTGGMSVVVDHLQNQTFAQTETQLKSQLRAARDAGDVDLESDILDRLTEVKAKKLNAKKLELPKQPAPQQQRQTPSALELGAEGVMDGDITDSDLEVIELWSDERSNGQVLRPWTVNRGTADNPDPEYQAGLHAATSVFANPRFQNYTVAQKLAEVDRIMGTEKPQAGQSVMGGGFTPRQKHGTIKTTPQQERIAVKTKFAGPGKSDADHIAAYRAQLSKVTASKGAR